MKMTNLEHLIKGVDRAKSEDMNIINNGDINNPGFIVISGDNGYVVPVKDSKIQGCSCPHHSMRGVVCKHMIKVSLTKGLDIAQLGNEEESPKAM
jgi:hypothetical protein